MQEAPESSRVLIFETCKLNIPNVAITWVGKDSMIMNRLT